MEAQTKRLGEKINRLRQRVCELGELKRKLQEQDDPQVSSTDPDACSMTSDGRSTDVVGYNVQVAVDTKRRMRRWEHEEVIERVQARLDRRPKQMEQ